MSIDLLERAIARLEELKAGATGLPWDSARTYVVGGLTEDGSDYNEIITGSAGPGNVDLIVTMSRTVDPILDVLRTERRRIIQNGGAREDQQYFNALALARAIVRETRQ